MPNCKDIKNQIEKAERILHSPTLGLDIEVWKRATSAQKEEFRNQIQQNIDNLKHQYDECLRNSSPGNEGGGTPPPPKHQPVFWDLYVMVKYRNDWKHSKYGIGNLINSVTLLPNEEISFEVKTWETSKVSQDIDDTTDQRNTSEIKNTTTDLKETTSNHQSSENAYIDVNASGSYFFGSVDVKAGFSKQTSELHNDLTKKTEDKSVQQSNEFKKTHRVRLSYSREEGSESKTTRKIKNINQGHTLNVNFFEVMHEYNVSMFPYEVTLVILCKEQDLKEGTKFPGKTFGDLIQSSKSADSVNFFIELFGESPVKELYKRWSDILYNAAFIEFDWLSNTTNRQINPLEKEKFRQQVLKSVRPTSGWIEPDHKGELRWAYEVIPGKENELLEYLYTYLPYNYLQAEKRFLKANENITIQSAYHAVINRYQQVIAPSYTYLSIVEKESMPQFIELSSQGNLPLAETILMDGPFKGKKIAELQPIVKRFVQTNIMEELEKLRNRLRDPDGTILPSRTWKTTLPTHGVYADVVLGKCSGIEDYFEIQRQFDLELKKGEIEKLKLEVEKLKLENQLIQAGKPQVVVETQSNDTSVHLDMNLGHVDTPAKVQVKKPEEP